MRRSPLPFMFRGCRHAGGLPARTLQLRRSAASAGLAALLAGTGTSALAQTAIENAAANSQQLSVAENILDICPRLGQAGGSPPNMGTLPGNQQDLFNRCNGALGLATAGDLDEAANILGQIAAEEVIAQEALVNGTLAPQTKALTARLSALSGRAGGGQLAGLAPRQRPEPIYLASREPVRIAQDGADASLRTDLGIGVFADVDYNFGNKDETDLEAGFDFDDISFTAGADYFVTDTLAVGLAGGYTTTDVDFDDDAGTLDGDGYNLAVYGLWNPLPQAGVTAFASYGEVDYTSERRIAYTDPNGIVNRTAEGDTDATQFEMTGGAYYDVVSGPWTYGPTLNISYLHTDIDGFTETGAQGLNLTFDDQEAESLQSWLGVAVSRTISLDFGVAVWQARAQWIHEFADDSRTIDVRYAADPFADSPAIRLTTEDPDRNRGRLGTGVSVVFAGGISAFADLEGVVGHKDVESYTVTSGIRFTF